ncbi:all3515 family Zur-repressed PEP-CTERM protein [Nostoc sp. CHAB 5836]|uniref:all3515 family Zur-repressed PEP-CTERM protein n=1 Tax=Nostoc sp. CHAB 5836 TaxID=2780404 RepID=UPI001E4B0ADB|nr:all3515 family Zur-repressed PEP-CTERM protein [Nostoc sp. CHAB 5836]MCC5614446.1 all3515 family Zur-repressed PEP-CTERM protein [Nostoc sp. CHAB 5836]
MVSRNTTCSKKQVTQTGQASASFAVSFLVVAPLVLSTALTPAQADDTHNHSEETGFYIGLDGLEALSTGTYAGLENPNYNRLTLLFAHRNEDTPESSHFHGIGAYSYSGSLDNLTINPTNTNNRIPESYSEEPPLTLLPGTGFYTGRLISTATDKEYSNLTIEPVASLKTSKELDNQYLFNSSNGGWQSSLEGASIGLQLASISTGLNIGDSAGIDIVKSVGDIYTIGSGDNFSFTPTFWTDAAAPLGTYSASFKLVDLGNGNNPIPFKDSGTFSFDFEVKAVPESSTVLGLGIVGLLSLSLSRLQKLNRSSLN